MLVGRTMPEKGQPIKMNNRTLENLVLEDGEQQSLCHSCFTDDIRYAGSLANQAANVAVSIAST